MRILAVVPGMKQECPSQQTDPETRNVPFRKKSSAPAFRRSREKRQAEILLKGVERGDAARNQVAASDGVRNVLFHFSDVLGIKSR